MEEGALVWRRVHWCGGGRPGVDEDAWMPLERGGWRARFGGERLRRERAVRAPLTLVEKGHVWR